MIFGLQCLILCCYYFTFSLSFQISPSTSKLSTHASNILAMHYFPFPIFFKDSPNFAFMCCMPSCFVSLSPFDWSNSSATFADTLLNSYLVDGFHDFFFIFLSFVDVASPNFLQSLGTGMFFPVRDLEFLC